MDFLVRRDELRRFRFDDEQAIGPGEGEALLEIDTFGLTSNNVTYGVAGDSLGYWKFFPAPEGWGRLPVWGFATVAASRHPGLTEGRRLFGIFPPSSQLRVLPARISAAGFVDARAHRATLPPAYNHYGEVAADPAYEPAAESHIAVLRPLFFLSFMLEDFLEAERGDAQQLVVSSASSRSALGLAFLARRRGRAEVIGLTSPQRVRALERLGVYSKVLGYDAIEDLTAAAATYVDLSGDGRVRATVHRHLAGQLRHSIRVGSTHWQAEPGDAPAPGPQPEFFFTPDRIVQRSREWGRVVFGERMLDAWSPFLAWARQWLSIRRAAGPAAMAQAYLEVLDGRVTFKRAHVASLVGASAPSGG